MVLRALYGIEEEWASFFMRWGCAMLAPERGELDCLFLREQLRKRALLGDKPSIKAVICCVFKETELFCPAIV